MFAKLFQWNHGKRTSKNRKACGAHRHRRETRRRLGLESLEDRQLLTALADIADPPDWDPPVPHISFGGWGLTQVSIYGTEHDDAVKISAEADGHLLIEVQGPYQTLQQRVMANRISRVTFSGGNGDDRFDGHVLDVSVNLQGGEGDDHLIGGSGNDLIDGGNGDDTLHGGLGEDVLLGGSGNDRIFGDGEGGYFSDFYGQADQIDAGSGDDFVDAGDGDDTVSGGTGNDEILGRNGDDRIDGGDGNDTIHGDGHDRFRVIYANWQDNFLLDHDWLSGEWIDWLS